MKIVYYGLLIILIFGLATYYVVSSEISKKKQVKPEYHREQKVFDGKFMTTVWEKDDIIKCWFDPIDSVTPQLVVLRKAQADSFINIIKSLK